MLERLTRARLDTNVLISLEDSLLVLSPNLANLTRFAKAGGHVLSISTRHPNSEAAAHEPYGLTHPRSRSTLVSGKVAFPNHILVS